MTLTANTRGTPLAFTAGPSSPRCCKVLQPCASDPHVLALTFHAEELPALDQRRRTRRATTGKRVEHYSAGRASEPHQPAHQVERLDRRMDVAPRPSRGAAVELDLPGWQLLAAGFTLERAALAQ